MNQALCEAGLAKISWNPVPARFNAVHNLNSKNDILVIVAADLRTGAILAREISNKACGIVLLTRGLWWREA